MINMSCSNKNVCKNLNKMIYLIKYGGYEMPFHKNFGAFRGSEMPKGGVKMSNSDILHSSKHKKMGTTKKKRNKK